MNYMNHEYKLRDLVRRIIIIFDRCITGYCVILLIRMVYNAKILFNKARE